MRKILTRNGPLLLLGALAFVFALSPSAATAQYREFTGCVKKINSKKVLVDNRQGDNVQFVKIDETKVEDTRELGKDDKAKADWDSLQRKDRISVSWKFIDKPRKAYIVKVLAPTTECEEM